MMQNKLLRVAAYARVSTEKDDQLHSLESQKKYFADYISHHSGWKFSGVYFDEGVSGTQTKNRTGFHEMIVDALAGRMDLILTKEVCRFARNTVDTLSYTRQLKEAHVGVIFTVDNIDTRDSDGELRLTIMASIAQEESRRTSERVKWGQKRRMEQGIVFGRDMLGYEVRDGRLFIMEEEVPIVQSIFHKYTNEGKGTHIIARELTEEGIRSKRICSWSATTIRRILQNEKYVGDLCQKKTVTPDYLTHKKEYNRGMEEKVYIRGHHEPIIDRNLWDRTQEELYRRALSAGQKKRHSNRYWCSGKIRCGECGCQFVSRIKKLSERTYRAWRCYQTANHGTLKTDADGKNTGCSNNSINERALLSCMKYCVSLVCPGCEQLREEILFSIREVCNTQEIGCDRDRVVQKIENIENKKRRAVDAMLEGILTEEELRKQSEWYDRELEYQRTMLAKIDKYNECPQNIKNVETALDNIIFGREENEMLYRELIEYIDIYREEKRGYHCLVVRLKNLPFGIRLVIKSTGRGETYCTEILESELIDRTYH